MGSVFLDFDSDLVSLYLSFTACQGQNITFVFVTHLSCHAALRVCLLLKTSGKERGIRIAIRDIWSIF